MKITKENIKLTSYNELFNENNDLKAFNEHEFFNLINLNEVNHIIEKKKTLLKALKKELNSKTYSNKDKIRNKIILNDNELIILNKIYLIKKDRPHEDKEINLKESHEKNDIHIKKLYKIMELIEQRITLLLSTREKKLIEIENIRNLIIEYYKKFINVYPNEPLLNIDKYENDLISRISFEISKYDNYEYFMNNEINTLESFNIELTNHSDTKKLLLKDLKINDERKIFESILNVYNNDEKTFILLKSYQYLDIKIDDKEILLKELFNKVNTLDWFEPINFQLKYIYLKLKYN